MTAMLAKHRSFLFFLRSNEIVSLKAEEHILMCEIKFGVQLFWLPQDPTPAKQ